MIGAIIGDMIGSVYEAHPIKTTKFQLFKPHSRFTDDSVLTVAVAYAILNQKDYATSLKTFAVKYPRAGYGAAFYHWMLSENTAPYNSWGNGSAMRVSPVGFAFGSAGDVLAEAEKSAAVTHNHPEGIKGAQATALAIFMARTGETRENIREEITRRFDYDLSRTLDEIRPEYFFDVSCHGTVPESVTAFLESENYEDAVRKGISLGGDSDTIACITGGIAQAYYKDIPRQIVTIARERLPEEFIAVIDEFNEKYDVIF